MRIASGNVTTYIAFVAVDATDLKTRETGLTGFTVYRSRNNGTATVFTTPTVAEASAANMPGDYWLLVDEDTTIAAGADTEEMMLHITHASMAPVTRTIELYRPKITAGETLVVSSGDIDGFSAAAQAEINAQVVDTLAADTYAEPGQGNPAATAALSTKLNYLYKWGRNKKDNDGSQNRFYADDGTTVDQKQTTSESGGVVTKGEMVTGP